MSPLIVVACGAAKQARPAPADELYTGALFRSCMRWAHSVTTDWHQIRILSAKHGFLTPVETVEPYDVRLSTPGAVVGSHLQEQAIEQGIHDASPVIVVGGKDYVRLARRVWPDALSFAEEAGGCTSLGAFRGRLKQLHGVIPTTVRA